MAKKRHAVPVGPEETRVLYGAAESYPVPPPPPQRKAPGRGLRRLTRVLGAIACGLALVILGGTLYAVFRDSAPDAPAEDALPGGDFGAGGAQGPGNAVFTGIGRLRISEGALSGGDSEPRTVVVVSVVFPYPAGDRPFTEELAGKVPLFRRIIRDYFGALPADKLSPLDEQGAKDELLRRFNAELQLGKIELLLFNELMILE